MAVDDLRGGGGPALPWTSSRPMRLRARRIPQKVEIAKVVTMADDDEDYYSFDTGVGDEHLAALGELALWSARLSEIVDYLVRCLSKNDERRTQVVEPAGSFAQMVRQARGLLDHSPKARELPRLAAQLEAASACMERRNELVHGYWVDPGHESTDPLVQIRARRSRPARQENVTVDSVRETSARIADLDRELWLSAGVIDGWIEHVRE